jgi:ribosomal protein L29
MTSNSNPKPQPTSPGWWWAEYRGVKCMAHIDDEAQFFNVDSEKVRMSSPHVTWLGPVLSHDEGQELRRTQFDRVSITLIAVDAQGLPNPCKCQIVDVSRSEVAVMVDCPEATDEIYKLRQRIADLEAQQARVMGAIDNETAKPLTKEQHKDLRRLQNYYADSAMALLDKSMDMSKAHRNIARNILDAINAAYAYEAIRNKINEAKAGEQ